MTQISIKGWSKDDRPREKLLSQGSSSLSNSELIALLIGSGTPNESAVELSKRILKSIDNNLNELGKFNAAQLQKLKGIGKAKAITIMAAMELGRRRKLDSQTETTKITDSQTVVDYFAPILLDLTHEEFWVMMLNRANKVIDHQKISQGGIAGTVTDIRIIFKKALEYQASSLIVCHNHPSGNISPSNADINITHKIKDAGNIMDINMLDHIIITDHSYYSFADEGMI